MSAQTPLVSIGIPVYNGENYLESALTRLLEQDFQDFELIVSDNASTDRTEEICRTFVERDPRVRYSRNPVNVGLAANHNRTIELARGKYFKWAAHDDDFPREMLTGFVRAIEEASPAVSMVYSICEYVNESGTVTAIDSDHISSSDPRPHRRFANELEHVHMYNSFYGLIRLDALRKTRLLGLYPMSDHVLLGELAILGTILEIPEPLLRIRRHGGRTFTANKSPAALRNLFTPGQGHRFSLLGLRSYMHFEIIRSAVLIPRSLKDKMLCLGVALAVPQWKWFSAYAGIQKRNLRRAFRSAIFSPADIRQLPMLVDKLKHPDPNASISKYLANQLSLPTRYLLSRYAGGDDSALQDALVKDLNRLIEGPLIYDAERFENVVLTQDLTNRLNKNPSGKSIPRVNRLLLEEAFPAELSKEWRFRFVPPMRDIIRGEA